MKFYLSIFTLTALFFLVQVPAMAQAKNKFAKLEKAPAERKTKLTPAIEKQGNTEEQQHAAMSAQAAPTSTANEAALKGATPPAAAPAPAAGNKEAEPKTPPKQ